MFASTCELNKPKPPGSLMSHHTPKQSARVLLRRGGASHSCHYAPLATAYSAERRCMLELAVRELAVRNRRKEPSEVIMSDRSRPSPLLLSRRLPSLPKHSRPSASPQRPPAPLPFSLAATLAVCPGSCRAARSRSRRRSAPCSPPGTCSPSSVALLSEHFA
jgi:hypothetical protein